MYVSIKMNVSIKMYVSIKMNVSIKMYVSIKKYLTKIINWSKKVVYQFLSLLKWYIRKPPSPDKYIPVCKSLMKVCNIKIYWIWSGTIFQTV